jgi:hypothetical protein
MADKLRIGKQGEIEDMKRYLTAISALFIVSLFSIAGAAQTAGDVGPGEIIADGQRVSSLQEAFNVVQPGGVIHIGPGTYTQGGILKRKKDGVSIYGSFGTVFDGAVVGRKGTFVIQSNDTTIEDIECRNVEVEHKNGACLRFEGTNITLRRVNFSNSENGILAGGKSGNILIEDSIFEGNGKAGRAHGMYINGGHLIIRRSKILSSKDQGHGIKSRAERTIIEDSIIASLQGDDSRLIDVPNGGLVAIRRCLLVEGPATVNWQLLSYGVEGMRHENNAMRVEGNVIVTDREGGSELILVSDDAPRPIFQQNMVVGRITYDWDNSNYFFDDRSELNLPPAPELPKWNPAGDK